jgi:hypothetical protein
MLTVACVLRSGAVYDSLDVLKLGAGVGRNLSGARFACLSDVPVPCQRIPLAADWPGWWAKMELFRPDIIGDLLYFDLDTIITGDLSDMAEIGRLTIMRDVYRPEGLQSSVMYIPHDSKQAVWDRFNGNPDRYMAECGGGGDQAFLETLWLGEAAIWQDELPGQVQSYKVADMATNGVPDNCRAAVFHGQPKPRALNWTL